MSIITWAKSRVRCLNTSLIVISPLSWSLFTLTSAVKISQVNSPSSSSLWKSCKRFRSVCSRLLYKVYKCFSRFWWSYDGAGACQTSLCLDQAFVWFISAHSYIHNLTLWRSLCKEMMYSRVSGFSKLHLPLCLLTQNDLFRQTPRQEWKVFPK